MTRSRWSARAGAVVLASVLVAGAAEENRANVIRYANDTLTVRLTKAPISEVLDQLAAQTGAEIRGWPRDAADLTVTFDDVPLVQALARLFGDQNFALVYGKGGRLVRMRLLGGTGPATVTRPPAGPQPLAAAQFDWLGPLVALVDHHPAVPVDGDLADAVGAPTATLRQLIDLSLNHEDVNVRDQAVRTGMAAVEADPALHAALNSIESAELMEFLRGSVSEQAEDVAVRVLKQAQAPDVRLKASAVMQRLRAGG